MGFGNQYQRFPGGVDCFCRFLSSGNEASEAGRAIGEQMKASGWDRMADDFLKGERYIRDPKCREFHFYGLPVT